MCDSMCYFTHNGLWLYQDAGHLTVAGAEFFGDRAQPEIVNFLSADR
jgi:hypothetical protein